MKAYRAYASQAGVTAESPRAAAAKFFGSFPKKRKCNVIEGETDGAFFVLRLSRLTASRRWDDVLKSQVAGLPAE
jgi:hypothetical protein